MSSVEAPCKSALEVDVDLVECALEEPVSTPDFMRMVFSHPDIEEETHGL